MTKANRTKKRKGRGRLRVPPAALGISALAVIGAYIILLSEEVGGYVLEGLSLALTRVIPTALPFMIISDLYMCYGHAEDIKPLGVIFEKIFGIPRVALRAFITGCVCGFPIGVKAVAQLYKGGALSRHEAERLCAYCSNPSCAFIIGAVGAGIYGDIKIGAVLFFSVIGSTLIIGILSRRNVEKINIPVFIPEQSFSFVESVSSAALSCLSVSAFISLFAAIGGTVKKHCALAPVRYALLALLEVTAGVEFFASEAPLCGLLSVSLSAFTLGFGGISVMLQSAYFLRGTDLTLTKYFTLKLAQGVICALICSGLFLLITRGF